MLSRSTLSRSMRLLVVAVGVTLGSLVVTAQPAHAAGAAYGAWTVAGANPAWTGTMNIPVTGFPPATYASNSSSTQVREGATVFLGPATPFGAVFGSSQNQQYLGLGTASGLQPSTTTFTFAQPTPASGWGFNVGDIDADHVTLQATGPDGPLSAADLGFQGGFNFCNTSPRPGGCTRPPFTDVPVWNPATGNLRGNSSDTDGASGWFRPTKPITSLTFRFEVISGSPAYQIWFAALKVDVGGTVTVPTPEGPIPPPPETIVTLRPPTGPPITSTPGPDGSFLIKDVIPAVYEVSVEVPPGFVPPPPQTVDATNGDVTGLTFSVHPEPPPPTVPPKPTPALPSPGPAIRTPRPARPMIPATGGSNDVLLPLGLVLVGLGAGCMRLARRLRAV